jgi:uncharacterized repeat protein (TIGR03803 family)
VLYRFLGGIDGATPVGGLTAGPHSVLFGATAAGGIPLVDCGTIFMLTPPTAGMTAWTKKVLHRFAGAPDGCIPQAGLIADADGVLRGTTYGGGRSGYGTVFELTPPAGGGTARTERVLYSFKFGTDGALPQAGLIADAHGALYGTTAIGGNACPNVNPDNGCGTVFKLSPLGAGQTHWTETPLHKFHGAPDGFFPVAGLVADLHGALYGTTENGGRTTCFDGCGTAFKVVP